VVNDNLASAFKESGHLDFGPYHTQKSSEQVRAFGSIHQQIRIDNPIQVKPLKSRPLSAGDHVRVDGNRLATTCGAPVVQPALPLRETILSTGAHIFVTA
jgi:hypothetical protein